MDISCAYVVKAKANSEISSFDKGAGGKYKVGGLQQKGEVGIDVGDGTARECACVGGHRDFSELVRL